MSRVRLVPMIVIVIVSLAVLLAGWRAYLRFDLVDPLSSALMKVDGVQSVVVAAGNPPEVDVRLRLVPDLQSTYVHISQVANRALGEPSNIVLIDHGDQELQLLRESLMTTLNQGIAKGDYNDMIVSAQRQAARLGVHARITMDEHKIYLQLAKHKNYLYYVMVFKAG